MKNPSFAKCSTALHPYFSTANLMTLPHTTTTVNQLIDEPTNPSTNQPTIVATTVVFTTPHTDAPSSG
ncbi:hypothetical protein GR268_47745 [Rhizobium leguminosarum]|nr:hypothetical protein [Rhizobium leguminosarum]